MPSTKRIHSTEEIGYYMEGDVRKWKDKSTFILVVKCVQIQLYLKDLILYNS